MCLAIYKPRGVQIAKVFLQNGFQSNNDGAGFAVATRDKRLETHKGFLTFETFWHEYQKYQSEQMVIHFRWATHGDVTHENCHPFELCNGQIAMAHNGVLTVDIPDDQKHKSDTRVYCETILEPIFYRMPVDDPSITKLLSDAIGKSNKLIFLTANGKFSIVNEASGDWRKGAWFSNSSYLCSYNRSSGFGGHYGTPAGYKEWWKENTHGRTTPGHYYKNGVEYFRGVPTGKADPWCDYKEPSRIIRLPNASTEMHCDLSDEELGILATDDLCDCGSYKVMGVGDKLICVHCGLERPAAQIIDCSDSPLADDDTAAAEQVACSQWEADQRKDIDTEVRMRQYRDNGE